MKEKKRADKRIYQALVLFSQFGLNMLVPIGLMMWLGIWLDEKLGTSWLTIVFFFIGAVAGFQNIFRMAKKVMDSQKTEVDKEHRC